MFIKGQTLQRLFFIALFVHTCLPISSAPDQTMSDQRPTSVMADTDKFQDLMSMSQDHTKSVEFCIQQLIQTVSAGKLKLTPEEQQDIVASLAQLQGLANSMKKEIYVRNTPDALAQAILLNNTIISFLINNIKNGLKNIDLEQLSSTLQKRYQKGLPEEILLNMAQANEESINKLFYAAEHIGYTWYNSVYNTIKDYNGYTIAKGCVIGAVTVFTVGCLMCRSNTKTGFAFIDNRIGKSAEKLNGMPGRWIEHIPTDAEKADRKELDKYFHPKGDSKCYEPINPSNSTIFQRSESWLANAADKGLVNTSLGLTLNPITILAGMYSGTYQWLSSWSNKKAKTLDKVLSGTQKPNAPEKGYEKIYFDDMVGCDELKELAGRITKFMKHPERFERSQVDEHRGIILFGPPQTGKTMFAKALRTLVQENLGNGKHIEFIDAKELISYRWTIEEIFYYAKKHAPAIIFFDEIDLIGATNREKNAFDTAQFLTCMQGLDGQSKQVIVIGATNRVEQLDKSLMVDGRFGRRIEIKYPEYQHRKSFLIKELGKRRIDLSEQFIDHMAQETSGASYNVLGRIISEAYILSINETRAVNQADFEKALDTEYRKIISTPQTSSDAERKITATYQAGKAIARHLLKTTDEVIKITINPVLREIKPSTTGWSIKTGDSKETDNEKLASTAIDSKLKMGEVFTKSMSNSELCSDIDQEKECIALLAGGMALKLLTGQTFTQCNKYDRAEAMSKIYAVISQGEKIDDSTKTEALKIKDKYEQEAYKLLEKNKDLLNKVIDMLLKQNNINRYEWQNLVSGK